MVLKFNQAVALLVLCLVTVPVPGFSQEIQDLQITAGFGDEWLSYNQSIKLNLSRPLQPSEGRLAVFIGDTDMTDLFEITDDTLVYDPSVVSLPFGESELTIYLVTPDQQWQEIARFPLRARNRLGLEESEIKPKINVGIESQVFEDHSEGNEPPREEFVDVNGGASLDTVTGRGPFHLRTNWAIFGTSREEEALRFSQQQSQGGNAPRIDLSQYLLEGNIGGVNLLLRQGHISFGSNRHLIDGFASRGIVATLPFGGWADFSVGVMNGQNIVGWDDFLGYTKGDNLVLGGTFGVNLLNNLPGRFRIEITGMWGKLQSLSSFNQQNTTDVEKSKGVGFRVLFDDPWWDRVHVDGTVSISRYTNPNNPLLDQGLNVVPVVADTENAYYLDVRFDVLKNLSITEALQANATVAFRHEKVDTFFQSVAAFIQPDLKYSTFEFNSNFGELYSQFLYYFSDDNLLSVPSVLTTKNKRWLVSLTTPFAFLIGRIGETSPWFPRLSYSMERVHQYALAFPENSNFDSNSQVPNQVSWNYTASLDWYGNNWNLGYTFNLSTIDNRQETRGDADFSTLVNGLTVGISPFQRLNFNLSAVLERAHSEEVDINDYIQRYGAIINFRTTENSYLTADISQTFGDSSITEQRNTAINLQWSINFDVFRGLKGQYFLRYFYQRTRDQNDQIQFNNKLWLWTINTGLNLSYEPL